jgi:photosystem II cytochrome c550
MRNAMQSPEKKKSKMNDRGKEIITYTFVAILYLTVNVVWFTQDHPELMLILLKSLFAVTFFKPAISRTVSAFPFAKKLVKRLLKEDNKEGNGDGGNKERNRGDNNGNRGGENEDRLNRSGGVELDEDIRTVRFSDGSYENRAYPLELVLTRAQVKRGKFLFNKACAYCHVAGLTKPDPNVGLDLESLSKAVPPRDSILGLVKFLKEPRTYDGVSSLVETHPSASRRGAYLFPVVRTLTEKDLVALAGHMLIQPRILNERWGGGKIYY